MRWKTKVRVRVGDERTVIKFAWLPMKTSTGLTVWLERYISCEKYVQYWVGDRVYGDWERGWEVIDSRLIG